MTKKFPFGDRKAIIDLEKDYWNVITRDEREAERNRIPGIVNQAVKRGYLLKDEFIEMACWKSRRPISWYQKNSESRIQSLSKRAFQARIRDEALRALDDLEGVALPTATAILHWFRKDTPIIDVRVCGAFGIEERVARSKTYSYGSYADLAERIMEEAKRVGVTLRQMDRALWVWDKTNKGRKGGSCR
ncbi:MAG: hypothetical protein D6807_00345 [Alphaproteobacteria bacterium]|nr:MAG: hypothetical protein D6807_00345 [Alphaproteobacteria bacterium]